MSLPVSAGGGANAARGKGAQIGVSGKAFASELYYGTCCFLLFFVTAAASFNGFYDKWHFREAGTSTFLPVASFEAIVNGTAARPYVYRQLLPTLANWIDQRIPEQTKDWFFTAKGHTGVLLRERLFSVSSPLTQSRAYYLRYWIVYVLTFLFAWIAVYAMYLLCKFVGYTPATAAFSAIVMVLLMPYFMTWGGYYFDYPELAFLVLVAWMALKFDWWWIIPVAALAAWNKESFLFFIPTLYPLLRQRSSRINALAGAGVLGLTCAGVYCVVRSHYQHNPGGTIEMHLMDQISRALHPFVLLEKTYGMTLIQSCNPLSVILIVWTAWRGWRFLPKHFQRHAQIAAAINFPLYFLFCAPNELRDLSFLYIALLLLLAANLTAWAGGQTETAPQRPA